MKIYTRKGDSGETGLVGGARVGKDHPRIEAYGTVDELNAWLGLARARGMPSPWEGWIVRIQQDLFTLGADLATPSGKKVRIPRMEPGAAERLETWIDALEEENETLASFILPGGTEAAAAMQVARAVSRRAERAIVALARGEELNPAVLTYVNRLSDFLFVLARALNRTQGGTETPWKP
jgi:cob(I)alamin adenosyltransferase